MTVSVHIVTPAEIDLFNALPSQIYKAVESGPAQAILLPGGRAAVHSLAHDRHSRCWIAERNGRPVGRVLVHFDHVGRSAEGAGIAFFSYFDCIDDAEATDALLRAVEVWSRRRRSRLVRGPFLPPHPCRAGLHVDTSQHRAGSAPYLEAHLARAGYRPVRDLIRLKAPVAKLEDEALGRSSVCSTRPWVVRPVPTAPSRTTASQLADLYNDAWSQDRHFVAITTTDVLAFMTRLESRTSELGIVLECDGELLGAVCIIPKSTAPASGSWLRKLIGAQPSPLNGQVALFGIGRAYRGGPDGVVAARMLLRGALDMARRHQFEHLEIGPVPDEHSNIRRIAERFGFSEIRRSRVYEKTL